ncbi:hypothetical protein C8R48DRAFT_771474 [Suillus tomentosus]|nr:hypothetical protein C8R48DRAFT_771474 [Suillus tomentosus]
MEDNPHPGASSQADSDTLRHAAVSKSPVAVVSTSENARRKRKIANLEGCENLESVKREKNSQGRAIIRRMIDLLDNVEELMSENDRDDLKDNDHNLDLTLILGQDRLRVGYVTLKKTLDNNNMQHDDHLHMQKKLSMQLQGFDGAPEDIDDDRTTQLMAQAQQLRDSQNRIDNLHTQLFDLRSRLYEVEHAHNMAEIQRLETLQTQRRGSRDHRRTMKLHSPPPKRKSMVHEYYSDGGQSIRWLTDEEFEPYDELSANEESSPVVKAVGGPLSCGLADRQRMSLSRCWALRRFQKVRDAADLNDSDGPVSAAGSAEI